MVAFEQIEKLKKQYTDQYVVVDPERAELRRFSDGFNAVILRRGISGTGGELGGQLRVAARDDPHRTDARAQAGQDRGVARRVAGVQRQEQIGLGDVGGREVLDVAAFET